MEWKVQAVTLDAAARAERRRKTRGLGGPAICLFAAGIGCYRETAGRSARLRSEPVGRFGTLEMKIRSVLLPEGSVSRLTQLLVDAANPARIILYGSYARGEASADSDIDIMVVEKDVHDRIKKIAGTLHPCIRCYRQRLPAPSLLTQQK
jgi:hypothetical protein